MQSFPRLTQRRSLPLHDSNVRLGADMLSVNSNRLTFIYNEPRIVVGMPPRTNISVNAGLTGSLATQSFQVNRVSAMRPRLPSAQARIPLAACLFPEVLMAAQLY